ncbi:MAG: hypothetical protein WBW37_15680, partial [Methyloceanibacter sp.]
MGQCTHQLAHGGWEVLSLRRRRAVPRILAEEIGFVVVHRPHPQNGTCAARRPCNEYLTLCATFFLSIPERKCHFARLDYRDKIGG